MICFTEEKQNKGQRTPFEYLSEEQFSLVENTFHNLALPRRKRLLNRTFGKVEEDWKSRALNDTRYICRTLKTQLERNFPSASVQTINGQITAYLRRRLGLKKDREDNPHHAVDAIVLSCVHMHMVQQITRQHQNIRHYKDEGRMWPSPWEDFWSDVMENASDIFITRTPNRKIYKEFQDATC